MFPYLVCPHNHQHPEDTHREPELNPPCRQGRRPAQLSGLLQKQTPRSQLSQDDNVFHSELLGVDPLWVNVSDEKLGELDLDSVCRRAVLHNRICLLQVSEQGLHRIFKVAVGNMGLEVLDAVHILVCEREDCAHYPQAPSLCFRKRVRGCPRDCRQGYLDDPSVADVGIHVPPCWSRGYLHGRRVAHIVKKQTQD